MLNTIIALILSIVILAELGIAAIFYFGLHEDYKLIVNLVFIIGAIIYTTFSISMWIVKTLEIKDFGLDDFFNDVGTVINIAVIGIALILGINYLINKRRG